MEIIFLPAVPPRVLGLIRDNGRQRGKDKEETEAFKPRNSLLRSPILGEAAGGKSQRQSRSFKKDTGATTFMEMETDTAVKMLVSVSP